MSMKDHILAGLREQFDQWVALLDSLSESQLTTPLEAGEWSIKDIVAHLWAWQQRTIARNEAAAANREPVFSEWPANIDPDKEGSADAINAWIYATYHDQTWASIYHKWKSGFQRFIDTAAAISERDLLDSERFSWLNGYSVAMVVLASYEHHLEHYEKLQDWLKSHGLKVD